MSLAQYRNKRSFTKTPEPQGGAKNPTGPLMFVVQKHQASQLHYDFRLEMDGVLESWAVPKGPSLNPEDKRMAVYVEDHPLDYATFEGIIPKNNYGAGTVMVWDQGVYCPFDAVEREPAEKILRDQLKKGHITIIMFGKKLKGEYALVRMEKADDNAWLLIKKGDEFASKDDILEQDWSAMTGKTMAQIKEQAEKKKAVWVSKPKQLDMNDAPKGEMPHDVAPMLATLVSKPFDRPDWLFEMKWDGYRAIAEVEAGKVSLYSRNGQPFNGKFAPIIASLGKFPGNAVLDGEVVVVDEAGHPKFQWLQDYPKTAKGELRYYVFDLLYFDGHNIAKLPLRRRKEILKQILPPLPHIFYSDHIEETGTAFFEQARKLGVEGIMAKNAESTYRPGTRSQGWLKIKTHVSQEAIICGFTEPKGGRKHFGALVLGLFKNDKLTYIGHTGGGFDEKKLESILKKLKPLEQKKCPFDAVPLTNGPTTWVKPKLVCEVTFSNWTDDGIMRQPIFVGLRDDKELAEVSREHTVILNEAEGSEESSKALDTSSSLYPSAPQDDKQGRVFSSEAPDSSETIDLKIKKHHVKVVNSSKVFWPQEGYTKGDLIAYYREIAPILLPHLLDHPQSLKRYPNGITGDNFYQKNVSSLNLGWIKTAKIKSEDKTIEYLLCQDEATLVYLINLGCIDLNPWSSRTWYLDYPDYSVIDLDPEDINFAEVVKVAIEFRKLFEKIGLKAYIKTSGATGMHIYIPLGAKYSYEQARQFTQLLSAKVHEKLPDITSMVRSPKDRQGKVYLDCLQNARGQTLASVYSVRPLPYAPVSTPLKWEELTTKMRPTQFTMKNIMKRISKHGDLFKPVLSKNTDMKRMLKNIEKVAA